ncbi:sulfotransferase [Halomonas almeriensis]|uniref:sulfotransferase n=1 Tax=Halomonas almeriensis TaxID=308163 RepID=UPI0025B51403|nr:sulfotransferase [Halomonas almeriensis]MDN3554345.1 sulfotransferase [Halomonas almeriensis]
MTTLITLLEGLALHLAWWGRALTRWRDPRAPMTLRRALLLLVALPVFMLVQGLHAVCLLLDELLFPGYRRVRVGQALFITGLPRSGTTFLHRTLAMDRRRYTTLTTWEALLAPSITQRKLLHGLGKLDYALGGWGRRGLDAVIRRAVGDFAEIHDVGLNAAEEDYLTLLPAGGCFILMLVFPGSPGLLELGHFDRRMSPGRRRRLLRFYERCLQRQLYADGQQRHLLSKNAAFGSWLEGLRQQFPEARFMVCVRNPITALSSQLSSVHSAAELCGTKADSARFQHDFLAMFGETLDHLNDTLANESMSPGAVIDMDDLREQPSLIITRAMAGIGEPMGPELVHHVQQLPTGTASRHQHSAESLAIPRDTMEAVMQPAYLGLLALPQRIRIST